MSPEELSPDHAVLVKASPVAPLTTVSEEIQLQSIVRNSLVGFPDSLTGQASHFPSRLGVWMLPFYRWYSV